MLGEQKQGGTSPACPWDVRLQPSKILWLFKAGVSAPVPSNPGGHKPGDALEPASASTRCLLRAAAPQLSSCQPGWPLAACIPPPCLGRGDLQGTTAARRAGSAGPQLAQPRHRDLMWSSSAQPLLPKSAVLDVS